MSIIMIIALFFLMFIISIKIQLSDKIECSVFLVTFYKFAKWIYLKLYGKNKEQNTYYQRLYDIQKAMDPAADTKENVENYFVRKIGLCLIVLYVGAIFTVLVMYKDMQSTIIQEDGISIEKADYYSDDKELNLNAIVGNESIENIKVYVPHMKYTKEQLVDIISEFEVILKSYILNENESADYVCKDIALPTEIEGYPFSVEYKWEDKDVIDRKGQIVLSDDDTNTLLQIEAIISYEDFVQSVFVPLMVYPKENSFSVSEKISNKLNEELYVNQNNSDAYFRLPTSIDGMEVKWSEKKKNNFLIFGLITVLAAVFIYIGKDKDAYDLLNKRQEQMLDDYPEIVSKLTLFVSAGMSLRSAWKKIVLDYRNRRSNAIRFAYEEMSFTLYEMESGIEENKCYNNFSKRCGVQKYIKLSALITQSIKLGSKEFLNELKKETKDAYEDKKSLVEKKGEQAGTKLLLPMMLMLVVVMVIIMVPAFMGI